MSATDSLLIAQEVSRQIASNSHGTAVVANYLYGAQALCASILIVVAWVQLRKVREATNIQTYIAIKKDFAESEFREVLDACYNNWVSIEADRSIIKVSKTINDVTTYSEFTFLKFNEVFLNNFEELAILMENNAITIKLVDSGYGNMILDVGNNVAIRGYLKLRKNNGQEASETFSGFLVLYEQVYNRLSKIEKKTFIAPKELLA